MAKRNKVLPARKRRDRSRDDDSLLLRSAESLGRVIGALQRQLDGATKRLADTAGNAFDQLPSMREIADTVTPALTTPRRRSAAKKSATTRKPGAAKGPKQGSRKPAPSRKRAARRKR